MLYKSALICRNCTQGQRLVFQLVIRFDHPIQHFVCSSGNSRVEPQDSGISKTARCSAFFCVFFGTFREIKISRGGLSVNCMHSSAVVSDLFDSECYHFNQRQRKIFSFSDDFILFCWACFLFLFFQFLIMLNISQAIRWSWHPGWEPLLSCKWNL